MRFRLLFAFLSSQIPAAAAAIEPGDIEKVFGRPVREHADAALAVLGFAAVPSETASALFLNSGEGTGDAYDFQAAQLGGGFMWSEDFRLYLEGYIGWNRYDPVLLVTEGAEQSKLVTKWTGAAATGGIGWSFPLTEDLDLRPMVHVTLGRVQSDSSVVAQYVSRRLGADDVDFLSDGGITAGGLGGSLTLQYKRRWENDYEADLTLRYTRIHLETIAGNRDLDASAVAETAGLWSRLRVPTGTRAFDRPVRTVAEFSASWMPGDQGEALRSTWLAQVGFGAEIDLEETPVPWITTTRLVGRYTRGDRLEGWSLGLAASF